MPHSHHSHSGQFCGHAENTLEELVQTAIRKGFLTFVLTEHIPRAIEDFYPEEKGVHTEESLARLFDDYMTEAIRVREAYGSRIQILIGFEGEWIRPSSLQIMRELLARHSFDIFVGSVHHTHTIPIDLDRATYEKARSMAGGTDERLFEDYFDAQYEMLQAMRPPIVGHFDLIRLLSNHRDVEFKNMKEVWTRITRNLNFIASYSGVLELNSAGLRKGLAQPYPCLSICQLHHAKGGRFALSDDSHGIHQVGTNYHRMLDFIREIGISKLYFADTETLSNDERFRAGFSSIDVGDLTALPFWKNV